MDEYHSLAKVYSFPVQLTWTEVDGVRTPTFRDTVGLLVYPYNEYLDWLVLKLAKRDVHENTIRSSVDGPTYALFSLANYLAENEYGFSELSDDVLLDFRKASLKAVLGNSRSRGTNQQAKRTVNVKMRYIYSFLAECHKLHRLPKNFIGWTGCRVQSSLIEFANRPDEQNKKDENKFPLCYKRVGTASSIDFSQYWATEGDVEKLEEYFWANGRPYTVRRNIIMLRVAEKSGWRVSSLNSILVPSFSREEFARQEHSDKFIVKPPRQKGGMDVSFPIPWELAYEVRRHIEEVRAPHLSSKAVRGTAPEELFLSETTGSPLTDRHVTTTFSTAFRAIGAPKGSGEHALRRKRAEDVASDEIAHRKSQGILVVPEDIGAVVQEELGHGSRAAHRAYLRATGRHRGDSAQVLLRHQLMRTQLQNDLLRNRVGELERKLAELGELKELAEV
jgi:hypothetical protein